MNESGNSLNPLSGNVDFPNIVSSSVMQQQASYTDGSSQKGPAQDTDALIALVQDLNQQNHELLQRITLLDEELRIQKEAISSRAMTLDSSDSNSELLSASTDIAQTIQSLGDGGTGQEQVVHLLNHLEFTQQANQRQSIRIESLETQLHSSQARVDQLESDNNQLSQRCASQGYRLNQAEDECRDLRLRLQRQQQYTLQFKAALEQCLEVPPPSYSLPHPAEDFTLLNDPPTWDTDPMDQISNSLEQTPQARGSQALDIPDSSSNEQDKSADPDWWVQPLVPKVHKIRSWAEMQGSSSERIMPSTSDAEYLEPQSAVKDWVHLPLETPPTRGGQEHCSSPSRPFAPDRFHANLLSFAQDEQRIDNETELAHNSKPQPTSQTHHEESLSTLEHTLQTPLQSGTLVEDAEALASSPNALSPASVPPSPILSAPPILSPSPTITQNSIKDSPVANSLRSTVSESDSDSTAKNDTNFNDKHFDDKLWQSLVNLIDLSAADGLNLPSRANQVPPLVDPETMAPESIHPLSAASSGRTSLDVDKEKIKDQASPLDEDIPPFSMDAVLAKKQSQRSQEAQALTQSGDRVIHLPSFLASPPTHPNTNPT